MHETPKAHCGPRSTQYVQPLAIGWTRDTAQQRRAMLTFRIEHMGSGGKQRGAAASQGTMVPLYLRRKNGNLSMAKYAIEYALCPVYHTELNLEICHKQPSPGHLFMRDDSLAERNTAIREDLCNAKPESTQYSPFLS